MNVKKVASVLVPFVLVVTVVALSFAFLGRAPEPYAGGELIDANSVTGITYEEDGDGRELGWRLVRLAAGENFTDAQTLQIRALVGMLFEKIRYQSMAIERLQFKVSRLEGQVKP